MGQTPSLTPASVPAAPERVEAKESSAAAAAPPPAPSEGAAARAAPGGGGGDQSESCGEKRASDVVVDMEEVVKKRGTIPITGRYSTSRHIDHDYVVETKVVGSGMSGPVQLAHAIDDETRKYAVKSFKKKGLTQRKRQELKFEVEIYLSLDHPHVARLEQVYETDEELHLVMEFMEGGELYDRLAERKRYTEECAAVTSRQMLLAVGYLHARQVVHRDLKLENFLYEKKDTDHLKLIDFGFAKFFQGRQKMTQACGSVHYVAPEVLAHAYTEKADMWSIGVITYMLLTGSPPFHGSDDDVLKKIKACKPHYSSRFEKLSEQAKGFVKCLLVADPKARLSAQDALEHTFVADARSRETHIDEDIVKSLRRFARASHFRRSCLSMMAWSLSREDRMHVRDQFLEIDTDRGGTIQLNEFKKVLEENFSIDCAEAERLFSSLDTDNDEEICYSEFLAAATQDRVRLHEDVLRKTFARFDSDESGEITVENLRQVLGDTFEDVHVEELLREADTRGTGSISYEAFLEYLQQPDDPSDEDAEPAAEDEETSPQTPVRTPRTPRTPKALKEKHTEVADLLIDSLLTEHRRGEEVVPPAPLRRLRRAATYSPGSTGRELQPPTRS